MRDLRFIFLGTGTSGGVPLIACAGDRGEERGGGDACASRDWRDWRMRQGAAVVWTDAGGRERCVLIDATPDLRMQALRHDLRRCDAIVFTHNHVDHIFGLDEVRRFNAVMRAPIEVWAERATMESLRRVYKHVFDKAANVNDSFVASLIPREIDPSAPIEIHGVRFTPIRVLHGRLPILGFRIEWASGEAERPLPLAYCTDTSSIPPESWGRFEGLDTVILDGLRHRHHPTHMTIDRAVEVSERVGARQAWIVHIGHEVVHAAVDAELPAGVNLAYDGLTLTRDREGPTGKRWVLVEASEVPEPSPNAASPAPMLDDAPGGGG